VAYEIRQNTDTLEVSTAQNYVELYNTITTSLANPETADLFYRGVQDFSVLDGAETVQFSAVIGQVMRVHEFAFFQWKSGALSDQLWEANEHILQSVSASIGVQQWWQTRRMWYTDDFRGYLESLNTNDSVAPIYPGMQIEK
jgi:hypothetical protein